MSRYSRAKTPYLRLAATCAAISLVVASTIARGQCEGEYALRKSTIDGGGATSVSDGGYRLGGTVGQHDAGTLAGEYVLTGGFWSPPASFIPDPLTLEPGGGHMNRFVAVVVPSASAGQETALRVTLTRLNHPRRCCTNDGGVSCSGTPCDVDSHCTVGPTLTCAHQAAAGSPDYSAMETKVRYVNSFSFPTPGGSLTCGDDGLPFNTSYMCATLGCEPEYRDWACDLSDPGDEQPPVPGLIYITGDAIVPSSTLEVSHIAASCGTAAMANTCASASAPLQVGTARWGDITAVAFGLPDGKSDVLDIPAVVNKLKGVPVFFSEPRTWLKQRDPAPNIDAISVVDLSDVVDTVLAKPYPANRTLDSCPHD